ncbi:glycosyltransferase [Brevibacillus choshinensis]|uniref:glycosyltransferase n=1 Tax=Brevibacillus choshinensis TaxID=54911 RepID=UPI002E23A7B5|nr:glycosyltransferase [Brevibacillus choshinensis]
MDNLLDDRPEVSVVIPVSDDAKTLRQMLENVNRMAFSAEVFVVCPTWTRISVPQAYSSRVHVIPSDSFHTYDQGRSLGSYNARGEVVLFLDERVIVAPALLKKYVTAIKNGADIAVTESAPFRPNNKLAAPRQAYRLLNHLLGLVDLGDSTMSKVPYACNQRALEIIGYEGLCTPPVGWVRAVKEKLAIVKISPEPAIQWWNASRDTMKKSKSQVLHDHTKAIRTILDDIGRRGGLPDGERYRSLLKVPGRLHLRSVFYQQPNESKRGKWGGKRKKKQTNVRKKR